MAKVKLLIGLFLIIALLNPLSGSGLTFVSADEEVKWLPVSIPSEGTAGKWILADGADVRHLTITKNDTLYCYANPTGTSYRLFKSTNGGYSWSYTGKVEAEIVDIAIAPANDNHVYYATSSRVYRSSDAGNSFTAIPGNPGGAGSNNVRITSLAVASLDNSNVIAVGTRDSDGGQYGGVYIFNESDSSVWSDTSLGSYDVYEVAFSPSYASDRQLVAVTTDETDTFITARIHDGGWSASMGNARINGVVPATAAIAFPGDYNSEVTSDYCKQFVAISTGTGNGDVYRMNGKEPPGSSEVADLNVGGYYGLGSVDITSLAMLGDTLSSTLLAGTAGSAQVHISTDGGKNWVRSNKPPTGESRTEVVLAPNFASRSGVYAVTSGDESGFSVSQDGGMTWNQLALVDSSISTLVNLAVSPDYAKDKTLFLITFGSGKHSLWRTMDNGVRWERVYSSALASVDEIDKVELSPRYRTSKAVFLAGEGAGKPVIWKSADNGQTFLKLPTSDPSTSASFDINAWSVAGDDNLFVGSFDGSNGLVYGTNNSGLWYSTGAVAGSQSLYSVAVSPDFNSDKTILIGNSNGWIYLSTDGGGSFTSIPVDATSAPLTGNISVAFDSEFGSNRTIYAASDTANKGIYRFVLDKSTAWESIDSTLPTGGKINQLIEANGTLYAANTTSNGGMERSLNPTYSLGPEFETVTRGLTSGATLVGLWLQGNQLWSINSTNDKLLTYVDSLNVPVELTSPPDSSPGIGSIINYKVSNVKIDWETLSGATEYKWQLDYETSFSSVPSGFEGTTSATSVRLPSLEPATTYYWRVRATEPVLSPWSDKWSFTTALGSSVTAPELLYPEAGTNGVPASPVFQWNTVVGANGYELLVATDTAFKEPVVMKTGEQALSATAWQCDINLKYNTIYYLKGFSLLKVSFIVLP